MAFNVNEFKAQGLRLGGARPNQFRVDIFFPFQSNNGARLRFLCRAASVPPSVVDEIPVYYFGRAVKYAGDRTFPDWEVTIMNDEDFALRRLFENWSNRINTLVSNRMDNSVFPTGYKVNGTVEQLGKTGNTIAVYNFEGMFPKIVDTMPLDWASQNQIQEFNITLAYDLWTPGDQLLGLDGSYSPVLPDDGVS
jgi:hypothetical protein